MPITPITITNANYQLDGNYGLVTFVNTVALATRTATLPAIVDGMDVYIKLDSSSALGSTVQILPSGNGVTIEHAASKSLGLLAGTGGCVHLVASQNNWQIVSYQGLL